MFGFWVVESWVREFTVVILFVKSLLGGLSYLDEVGQVLAVHEVLVQVVFEVLEEVHMLLNEIVSSNSWEGESFVIELP